MLPCFSQYNSTDILACNIKPIGNSLVCNPSLSPESYLYNLIIGKFNVACRLAAATLIPGSTLLGHVFG